MWRRIVLGGAIVLLAGGVVAAHAAGPPAKTFPVKVAVVKGKVKTYGFAVAAQLPGTMTLGPGLGPTVNGVGTGKAPKGAQVLAAVKSTGKSSWEVLMVVDGRKAAAGGTVAASISLSGPLAGVPATEKPDPKVCDMAASTQQGIAWALYVLIGPSDSGQRLLQLTDKGCK